MGFKLSCAATALLLAHAAAFPAVERAYGPSSHEYHPPRKTDSRAPCPALNTLANHGYISRDGRDISSDMLSQGFLDGFGLGHSVIDAAVTNAFQVCQMVTGKQCTTLTNLTLLSEPHLFEHDMSLGRQDYKPAYANGGHVNNFNFNASVFQTALDVVGGNTHMDYSLAELVHLSRESLAYREDYPGWFVESRDVQLFEIAFMYAVISDPALPDFATEPKIRVDWWKYWWTNESFPTPLGWKKPNPPRDISFILSVSSRVDAAPISSTPYPLPSTARATASASDASDSESSAPTTPLTLFPLATEAPYVAPDFRYLHRREKGEAAGPKVTPSPAVDIAHLQSAESKLGPAASFPNPYAEKIPLEVFSAKAQYYQARVEKLEKMLKD